MKKDFIDSAAVLTAALMADPDFSAEAPTVESTAKLYIEVLTALDSAYRNRTSAPAKN